mgnify:CR=1 FL=1
MVRELWGGESVCESLSKQRKSAEKVEIPDAAFGKSLPKFPIFLIWVENPSTAIRKSLPKKRKNAGVLTKQKKRTGKSALMVGKEAGSCLIFGGKRVI